MEGLPDALPQIDRSEKIEFHQIADDDGETVDKFEDQKFAAR